MIISADGNFHLHSFSRVKSLLADPSMFGNHGFFVPHDVAQRYLKAADAMKNVGPVSILGTFMQIRQIFATFRIVAPAITHKLDPHLKTVLRRRPM